MSNNVKDVKIPPEIEALANKNAIVAIATRIKADTWSSTEEMLIYIIKALVDEQLRLQLALESGMRFVGPLKHQKYAKDPNKQSDVEHMPGAKLYFLGEPPSSDKNEK